MPSEVPHKEPPTAQGVTETVKKPSLEGAPDPKDVMLSYRNEAVGVMVYKLKNNKKVFVPLKG